jgi:nitrogen regulatory protein PII
MKQIIAIVKPFLAERVLKAINDLPIEEIVVREAKGFGRQKDYVDLYRNNEFSLVFVAKLEISIFAHDEHIEQIVQKISSVSRTGRLGDGKIMILPLLGQAIDFAD